MATGKRYYWMKLKESFMTSDIIDYFMSQPNGANYVVLYQILCLKTINTDGRLSRQIGEIIIPYDAEKIQRDCKWFSIDTIRVALNLYKSFGLVYEDVDGTLVMTDHDNLVGSETDSAARMRTSRASRNNQLSQCATSGEQSSHIVTPDIENRYIEKEIRDKRKDKDKDTEECCTAPETVAVLTLPLNDGTEFPITEEDIRGWTELYPAVDILQECRKMRGWCQSNPTKRKTKRGVSRFINSWLSSEQDRGGTIRRQQQRSELPYQDTDNQFLRYLEDTANE